MVDTTCTLAQAINEANGATNNVGSCMPGTDGSGPTGHDTIELTGNITLTAHPPDITSNITINGNGHTIDGANNYRPISIETSGVTLILRNMTLTKCRAKYNQGGGAIYSRVTATPLVNVTLNNVTVSNSRSTYSGSAKPGGGAFISRGALTINDSVFRNNSAYDGGGAISTTDSTVEIRRSSFHGNRNTYGGGFGGGALFLSGGLSNNITNSTFYNNNGGGEGSAIYLRTAVTSALNRLTHLTITGNSNGPAIESGHASTVLHLRNSIIRGNPGGDCKRRRALATNQNNIIGAPGNCGPGTNGSNADPLLASSPTGRVPSFALLPGSPAIDAAGDCSALTREDQRGVTRPGVTRPYRAACDIGAYEYDTVWSGPLEATVGDLRVTPGNSRLTLGWTAPSVPGDTAIRGYQVQYRETVCTKPKKETTRNGEYTVYRADGVPVYVHCDESSPNQPGPWIEHGAWAGSYDPIARQTTRVIDGLVPGVVYDVRVRTSLRRSAGTGDTACQSSAEPWPCSYYVSATATPSGGISNARLLQIQLQPQQ